VEVPAFLDRGGERLFSVLHRPSAPPLGGFLFCHPLGEEKLWAHRVYVSLARDLAAAGWTVLRFDFRGEGDSDREFQDTNLVTRIEDTQTALAALRSELPPDSKVTLFGLRLGGSVAATVAAMPGARVESLILCDPIVRGAAYMQELLMINLAHQMALHRKVVHNRKELVSQMRGGVPVNIEGYLLSDDCFEQLSGLDLTDTMAGFQGSGLVVQIDRGPAEPRKDFQELADKCPSLQLARCAEEPFWKELRTYYQRAPHLTEVTLTWAQENA
jgi:pimeloyl-ACP methyl ester carboxylesterase